MNAPRPIHQPQEIEVSDLDFSMLSEVDLLNIALQRSEVLSDEKRPNDMIREWSAGQEARLRQAVSDRGMIFAQRAMRTIQIEFEQLQPVLDPLAPQHIADIGCGYAFFGLLAYARYGCDLMLIDIEENERRHFGFEEEGAAYSDLEVAKQFLVANGVPEGKLRIWNPELEDAPEVEAADDKPDLAVSFLACGFHFPVDMYVPFFRFGVRPKGAVLLDLRSVTFQENRRVLAKLGHLEEIARIKNRRRVLLRKGKK